MRTIFVELMTLALPRSWAFRTYGSTSFADARGLANTQPCIRKDLFNNDKD